MAELLKTSKEEPNKNSLKKKKGNSGNRMASCATLLFML